MNAQLELLTDKKYKHFATLSFIYYASLKNARAILAPEKYFTTRIESGLFYGLRDEYYIHTYLKPNKDLGIRSYKFFSYPMRVIYYAIGLYLLKLTQKFLDEYYAQRKHIYLVLLFKDNMSVFEKYQSVLDLIERISSSFHFRLSLKFNAKTNIFWLNRESDIYELLRCIKQASAAGPNPFEVQKPVNVEEIESMVEDLLAELGKLTTFDPSTLSSNSLEPPLNTELLKNIYEPNVIDYLSSSSYLARLEKVFLSFDFELMKIAPRELTLLILKCPEALSVYRKFLKDKPSLSVRDVDLFLALLSQDLSCHQDVFTKLGLEPMMRSTVAVINKAEVLPAYPGYYGLRVEHIEELAEVPKVAEQIKLRVINEDMNNYSLALNHLYNEIQCICYKLDAQKQKKLQDYDVTEIIRFLNDMRVKHTVCVQIKKLADRRNLNQISHSGNEDLDAWAVSKTDYQQYKAAVHECISHLYNPDPFAKSGHAQFQPVI